MTDNWKSLSDATNSFLGKIAPVPFEVKLQRSLADAVRQEAVRSGNKPEAIIAEAVRHYIGDAA